MISWFLLQCKVFSQNIDFLPITKLDTRNGLSSSNVSKILQDKYGFMWFSTDNGLNRFDGINYTIFTAGNKKQNLSVLGSAVFDIAVDSTTDNLWALTAYGGLNKVDIGTLSITGRFPVNDLKSGNSLWSKCFAIKGNYIFIGTNEGIAIRFNTATNQIEQEKNIGEEIKGIHIDDIFSDSQNRVWLFLSGYGILIIDTSFHVLKSIPALQLLPETKSNIQFRGHAVFKEYLLIATNEGLKVISIGNATPVGTRKIFVAFPSAITHHELTAISERQGEIIFCGKDGLYILNATKNAFRKIIISRHYEDKDWFTMTYCIYQTAKSIWIGTYNGVGWIKDKASPFNAINNSMDGSGIKLNNNCFTLYNLDDSTVIACGDNGLYKVNHITDIITKYNFSDIFLLAFSDPDKNIVASGYHHGLKIYDKQNTARDILSVYPELLPLKNDTIVSCQVLDDSLFFLASWSQRGMYMWNIKRKTVELKNSASKISPLPSDEIKRLYLDLNKRLWILCNNTISIYNPFTATIQNLNLTIPGSKQPLSINIDICELNNHFWILCYGLGIVELSEDFKIKNIYSEKDGISNLALYKIFPLNDSSLIVSSNNGLLVLNIKSKKINNYFEEDGLQSDNFNEASGCINKNYIFFGGANGLTKIDIQKLTPNKTAPQFYFTTIKTETKSGLLDTSNLQIKELYIPNNWLQTKISFVGINYLNPKRVTYQYRIKENGSTWIDLGTQNFVTLIGLSPGDYTLEVKAANEDGVWCEPKTLKLTFLPKWYQTALFKAAVILFAGGLFYSFYRYRITQLKKQQQIRKEIASDLHDDLGGTLNSLKLFANLAEAQPNKKEYFTEIKESIKYASTVLRDMIWVLDDTGDNIEDLVKRIKQFAEPLAKANNIEMSFSIDEAHNILLNKTEKRNLLLISKEAINNCIKYAECKNIRINFSETNRKITLMIHDDGCGFDNKEITPGHGLKNIHERAKQIRYTAQVYSEKGEGTKIVVTKK